MKTILCALLLSAVAAPASAADYEHATTTSNALIRVAPSAEAPTSGSLPTGTKLAVEICFNEGEYCLVTGAGVPPGAFIGGELMTQDGQGGMTIRSIEQAKWKSYREADAARASKDYDTKNIVVWGDSLSADTFGDELQSLLPGRSVSMQGVPGQDGRMIGERMLADTSFTKRIQVIWDRHWSNESVDQYMRELAPMIDRAKSLNVPFFVVSDIPDIDGLDTVTPEADAADTAAFNKALKAAYPDNYLDMVEPLTNPALHRDGLHLSPAGEKVVAKTIAAFITANGW